MIAAVAGAQLGEKQAESNESAPLVTVIAVSYNHASFVAETLESIRSQSYPRLQIVIVDDCSADSSQEIVRNWIASHGVNCTFSAHQKNKGLCASLNEALGHVKGKYVAMISCDDSWLSDKIARQVAWMEALPEEVGVVYSDADRMNEKGEELAGTFIREYRKSGPMPEGDIFSELLQGNFIPAMAVLVRAACYARVGGFDESLYYEDYDMWLRIAKHFRFSYMPAVVAKYRVRGGSLYHGVSEDREKRIRFIRSNFAIFRKYASDAELTREQRAMAGRMLARTARHLFMLGAPRSAACLAEALRYRLDVETLVCLVLALFRVRYETIARYHLTWR